MQCEDTERAICTAFMFGEDKEKKIQEGGSQHIYMCPLIFYLCVFV